MASGPTTVIWEKAQFHQVWTLCVPHLSETPVGARAGSCEWRIRASSSLGRGCLNVWCPDKADPSHTLHPVSASCPPSFSFSPVFPSPQLSSPALLLPSFPTVSLSTQLKIRTPSIHMVHPTLSHVPCFHSVRSSYFPIRGWWLCCIMFLNVHILYHQSDCLGKPRQCFLSKFSLGYWKSQCYFERLLMNLGAKLP